MTLSRRNFIQLVGAASLAGALPSCATETPIVEEEPEEIIPVPTELGPDGFPIYVEDPIVGPASLFSHGIASGDPTDSAIILWTRVSPDDPSVPALVFWECASDAAFTTRHGAGWIAATARHDFTAKADAQALPAGTNLYYRFRSQGQMSIVGRTKTASSTAAQARFALASCARFEAGYYIAYGAIAELDDLDAVIHVGDYIYEYADGVTDAVRSAEPANELFTLADYRTRYSCYRRDVQLQAMHARHPVIAVWDDHEVVNDAWSTGMPADSTPSPIEFSARKKNALRAHGEWMPVRVNADGSIHRSFRFGPTDLFMLDTRYEGRVQQTTSNNFAAIASPARTLLGSVQEEWLASGLASTNAQYCLIGQQLMMAQLALRGRTLSQGGPNIVNPDQWDGYQGSRAWIFDQFARRQNVVVLSGDLHVSFASELVIDPWDSAVYNPETGAGVVGVELLTPGITSPSGIDGAFLGFALDNNPHILYGEIEHRGFVSLEFDSTQMRASYNHVENARDETSGFLPPVQFEMMSGSKRLVRVGS
ncbi:MAG: alkaline phosphatase D family protein [Sandaracinaceae bacterium]|nr:alkaline phosphatase D family protein [Sandaracinaceae bacterium]